MSLSQQAKNGVKWTIVSSVSGAVFQLLQMSILAHYLEKKAFGIMAIALFVINFSQLFIDMGISNAIIYRQDVNHKQLSTLYWLNLIIGLLFFSLLFVVAPFVSTFYNEPLLKNIIIWIGISFLIQPFGMQFSVLLRKELLFKELAIRDIVSKFCGFLVGIVLAYLGFGIYSLVFSNLVFIVIDTIMLLIIGLKIHRPSFYFRISEIKIFLSFGIFQMGEKTLNYVNDQIDSLIIGKLLGVNVLGNYNVSKNFTLKPYQAVNPVLTKVAFPVMAKVQDDISKLKYIYLKIERLLATVNFPVYFCMAFFANNVVHLVFGKNWDEAIQPLRILAIYSLIRSTMNPIGSLQLARGKAGQGFYWNLFQFFLVPIFVFVGSRYNIIGVCYSLVLAQFCFFLIAWRIMVKELCKATFTEYCSVFVMPIIVGLIPVVILFPTTYYFNFNNSTLLSLALLISYFVLVGIVNLAINKNYIVELISFLFKKSKVELL